MAIAIEWDVPCSVDDLTVCGPDPAFSIIVSIFLAALVVGWWLPLLAATAAVSFVTAYFTIYDFTPDQILFAAWAALHVGYVIYLRRARATQRRLATQAVVPVPSDWLGQVEAGRMGTLHRVLLAGAPLGIAVALIAGVLYQQALAEDRDLARGSQVVTATVTGVSSDGYTISVTLDRTIEGMPETVELEPIDTYGLGEQVPLRINPAAPDWTHLVAEPPDRTYWLFLAAAALLAGAGCSGFALHTDLRRRVLTAARPDLGVPVRVLRVPGEPGAGIAVVDSDLVCADTPLGIPAAEEKLAIAVLDEDSVVPAEWGLVTGDFCDGGYVAIVTKDVAVAGTGTIRIAPELIPFDESWSDPEDEEDIGALLSRSEPLAVDGSGAVLELPWRDETTVVGRLVGVAWLLGAVLAMALTWWLPTGDEPLSIWNAIIVSAAFGNALVNGAAILLARASVDESEVRIVTLWRSYITPLGAIAQVRTAPGTVLLMVSEEHDSRLVVGSDGESEEDDEDLIILEAGEEDVALARAVDRARDVAASQTSGPLGTVIRWRWTVGAAVVAAAAQLALAARGVLLG